jgi:hypothetical protein
LITTVVSTGCASTRNDRANVIPSAARNLQCLPADPSLRSG